MALRRSPIKIAQAAGELAGSHAPGATVRCGWIRRGRGDSYYGRCSSSQETPRAGVPSADPFRAAFTGAGSKKSIENPFETKIGKNALKCTVCNENGLEVCSRLSCSSNEGNLVLTW